MLKCALGPHEGAGGLARPLQDVGEPAALRDFSPVFVRFGSSTTDAVKAARSSMSALPRKRTSSRQSRYVRFVPKADSCTAAK
jgi:hypothetical protein